jgi:pimeloyl-ACP methyl ester carboxylesterase
MKHYLLPLALSVAISANAAQFDEQELTVRANDGIKMGATLTTPQTGKPRAAIVLASGSGTQNRDEEIYEGKKPFKTLAEYLSSNGYAVLRVDDRGLDNSADAEGATLSTYAADVASAVNVADSLFTDIPVGIIGHSAGSHYAIINANTNPKVDFIVTLAAGAWQGDSIIMSQARAIATTMLGKWEPDAETLQRRLMSIAKSNISTPVARAMLMSELSSSMREYADLPNVQQVLQAQVNSITSPWYRDFLRYDPAADISAVNKPWLALNGSKDLQVLPENLATIHSLNPKADTRIIEGVNHMFQKCHTGLMNEYETLPGDLSQDTLDTIGQWLDSNIAK